ncbi:hypothetical protein GCM10009845_38900 [Pedococcus bigeumensis]
MRSGAKVVGLLVLISAAFVWGKSSNPGDQSPSLDQPVVTSTVVLSTGSATPLARSGSNYTPPWNGENPSELQRSLDDATDEAEARCRAVQSDGLFRAMELERVARTLRQQSYALDLFDPRRSELEDQARTLERQANELRFVRC